MNPLGWMRRKFKQNNDEQSINVSTGKLYSCFTTPWEVDEKQQYHEPKSNPAHFRQPRGCTLSSIKLEAHVVEKINEEEVVEMTPEFLHRYLAIGTLGSVSTTKEAIIPKVAMPFENAAEKENKTQENECKKLENPNKKDTKENKNMVVSPLKVQSKTPETKEEENEQKTTPDNLFKKNATSSYKRSGELDRGVKKESHSLHFMKKMLKKLNFTSRHISTSVGGNAIFCDLTSKKSKTKTFQKSRRIHPEEADLHVTKSHNYDVDTICYYKGYDKEMILEDEDIMYPQAGVLLKDMVSSSVFANKPINNQPTDKRAHWIKTDEDYFVLEFEAGED